MTNFFAEEITATFEHFMGPVLVLGAIFASSALVISRHPVCPLRKLDNLVAASVGVTKAPYSVAQIMRRTGLVAQLSRAAVLPEVIVALAFDIASAAPVGHPVDGEEDAEAVIDGVDVALLVADGELATVVAGVCAGPPCGRKRNKVVMARATTTIAPRTHKSIRRFLALALSEPASLFSLIVHRLEPIRMNS